MTDLRCEKRRILSRQILAAVEPQPARVVSRGEAFLVAAILFSGAAIVLASSGLL